MLWNVGLFRSAAALSMLLMTGIAAADFSRIRNANIGRFTVDRLMTVLGRLDQRVDVKVKVRPNVKRAIPVSCHR